MVYLQVFWEEFHVNILSNKILQTSEIGNVYFKKQKNLEEFILKNERQKNLHAALEVG